MQLGLHLCLERSTIEDTLNLHHYVMTQIVFYVALEPNFEPVNSIATTKTCHRQLEIWNQTVNSRTQVSTRIN